MDMDTLLSGIHAYLSHRGWTRTDSVRHVWLPPEQTRYLWPRRGDLVLAVVGCSCDDNPARVEDDHCAVTLLAMHPLPSGGYTWDFVARPSIAPGAPAEVAWTAALWAVQHGLPLSLSVRDLWEIADEMSQSESKEGGNHD